MNSDCEVRCDVQLVSSIKGKVAEVACLVIVVLIRSTELPVAAVLEEHACKVEHSLIISQPAHLDVLLIEWIEEVLKLATCASAVVCS